jgi:hypothetical protein
MAARAVAAARWTERATRSKRAATPSKMGPKLRTIPERTVWMMVVSMMHFFFHFPYLSRFMAPPLGPSRVRDTS